MTPPRVCAHTTTTTTHHNRTQALPAGLPAGKPFALLLPRGRCPFEQKAVAAEAAGAALAIIYNNEEVRCAFWCVGAACACVLVDGFGSGADRPSSVRHPQFLY